MRKMRNLLTDVSIPEPWRRCRGRSTSGANGVLSFGSSSQRAIRTKSLLGTGTSSGSFTSSTCVQSIPLKTGNSPPFQTELAIDTNIRVANTQTMVADTKITVANTETIVADTQVTVTNIETKVANMHQDMLAGRGQNNSVGKSCSLSTAEYLPFCRLKPGQRH